VQNKNSLLIWQTLKNQGGYWTATELAAQFGLPRIAGTNEVARELTALRKAGHVVEIRADHRRKHTYGVTAKCIPPAGETLELL
jgi:hypothetical protein